MKPSSPIFHGAPANDFGGIALSEAYVHPLAPFLKSSSNSTVFFESLERLFFTLSTKVFRVK